MGEVELYETPVLSRPDEGFGRKKKGKKKVINLFSISGRPKEA